MPFEYERDDDRRRITVRPIGSLTADTTSRIAERHRDENAWGYAMLFDLTLLTAAPHRDEVQRIADYVQRQANHRPRGPVAIIAPDAALFGLARMYAAFADPGLPLRVFRDAADAEQWLSTIAFIAG